MKYSSPCILWYGVPFALRGGKGTQKTTLVKFPNNLVQTYWKIKESSLQISYAPEHTVLYLRAALLLEFTELDGWRMNTIKDPEIWLESWRPGASGVTGSGTH